MKTLFTLLACALLALPVSGFEIVRGTTLTDGQPLYASDLHGLIDNSSIGVQFYNDQQTTPVVGSGYYFLVLDPANQVYRRITAQSLIYGNTNFWLNQSASGTAPSNCMFLFYDGSNNVIRTITASNLFLPSRLSFANSNVQVLPAWVGPFSGMQTNNPPSTLFWGTNGIPYSMSLSNLEAAEAADLGTNFSLAYTYNEMFRPWSFYTTNSFTNAWGYWTNFPITNLFMVNSSPPSTNTPTLMDPDTVPVASTGQTTNTSATLAALAQYMTAKNTPAKVQFNGGGNTVNVTGSTTPSDWLLATAHGMTVGLIKAVSFQFAGTASTTLPTTPQVLANHCYYALATNANNFVLFTNYTDASIGLHPVKITGTVSATPGDNVLLYINNNSPSFNADAIQLCSGASIHAGYYAIFFRTNLPDALYYFQGNVQPQTGRQASGIEVTANTSVTVSNVLIDTFDVAAPGGVANNRVWVSVHPQ